MSKILLANWSTDFPMAHECEKLRMKEATNDLETLISSLSREIDKMPIENCAIGRRRKN